MSKQPNKVIAVLTVTGIGAMTERRRTQISSWLYDLADHIRTEGDEYTVGRFRARFYDNEQKVRRETT